MPWTITEFHSSSIPQILATPHGLIYWQKVEERTACCLRFLWTEWRPRFFASPRSLLILSQQWVLVALIHIWAVPCVLISMVSGDPSGGVTPRHLVLPFSPFSLIPCSPLTTWFRCHCRRRLTLLLKIVVLWQMLIEEALKVSMHCNGKKITQV